MDSLFWIFNQVLTIKLPFGMILIKDHKTIPKCGNQLTNFCSSTLHFKNEHLLTLLPHMQPLPPIGHWLWYQNFKRNIIFAGMETASVILKLYVLAQAKYHSWQGFQLYICTVRKQHPFYFFILCCVSLC